MSLTVVANVVPALRAVCSDSDRGRAFKVSGEELHPSPAEPRCAWRAFVWLRSDRSGCFPVEEYLPEIASASEAARLHVS